MEGNIPREKENLTKNRDGELSPTQMSFVKNWKKEKFNLTNKLEVSQLRKNCSQNYKKKKTIKSVPT